MKMELLIINYFVIVIIFLSGLFIQNLSNINKKSIFYGVRIPIGYERNKKLALLHRKYQRNIIMSFGVLLIILTIVSLNVSDEAAVIMVLPETLLGLVVLSVNYLAIHNRVGKLDDEEGWSFDSDVVIVDTSFREKDGENKKTVISPGWFLIPLTLMAGTIGVIAVKAISPGSNPAGQTGHWGDAGFSGVLAIIIIQVVMNLIFFGAYRWTEKAKQSLNGGKIGEIRYRSRKMRYGLSVCYLIVSVYTNLLFMLIGFSLMNVIRQSIIASQGVIVAMIITPVIIMLVVILVMTGVNKSLPQISVSEAEQQVINRKDDQHYKFGSIYYNPNDPSLFVEKRVGLGMTLNFARPAAKVMMGIVAALVVGALVLTAFIPGMTRERQVEINQNSIVISGIWGKEIAKDQISKVVLETQMPTVIMKTNGADIGNKRYGDHKLEGYDRSVLFIGDVKKPFVAIYLHDDRLILINYSDEEKTKTLYDKIINTMNIK